VIQTTPYIGHPAYKAMGARAAYTLATALFIGGAGVFGYFSWLFMLVPRAVVFPILVFVGLEITAQSFHATPRRHFPALALACVPALAYLALMQVNQVLDASGKPPGDYPEGVRRLAQTLTALSGGFILTSLLWATALAKLIDGRARAAAGWLALAGVLSLFGVVHSPFRSGPILTPAAAVARLRAEGRPDTAGGPTPYHWAVAYLAAAAAVLAVGRFGRAPDPLEAESAAAV
jgi:AGZA family xanthine/uracil permease-like MFS transporter